MTRIRNRNLVRGLFIGLPVSLAAAATLFYGIFAPGCDSTLIAEFPAPHRPLKAAVYVRKCRVTQDFATQVSLLDATATVLPDTPNVLRVEGDKWESAPSGVTSFGAPPVAVIWATDTSLTVRYDTTRAAVRFGDVINGIKIHFEIPQ